MKEHRISRWDFYYLAFYDGLEELTAILLPGSYDRLDEIEEGDLLIIKRSSSSGIVDEDDFMVVDIKRIKPVAAEMVVIKASAASVSRSYSASSSDQIRTY